MGIVEYGRDPVARDVVRPTQVAAVLEPDLYRQLLALAADNERSVAAEVRLAIRRHLAAVHADAA